MDGTRGFGRGVTGNAARKRKLGEEPAHAVTVLPDVGVELCVAALEVGVGNYSWPAVSRAGNEQHIEIVSFDNPVAMCVDEIESRSGAPVPEQPHLDVLRLQRFGEQGIIAQID